MYTGDLPQKQDTETWVVPHNPDPVVVRGQEAWHRLEQGHSWDDWLAVGEAIQYGRHLAMLEAHTNEPSGPRYQAVFGEWLQTTGFHQIDKAARSRLFDCLEHRAEIEAWRQKLPLNKRLQLNHPDSIWRNWQNSTVAAMQPSPRALRLLQSIKTRSRVSKTRTIFCAAPGMICSPQQIPRLILRSCSPIAWCA